MANTWNQSGTTWGQNTYGTQSEHVITLTGVQAQSEVGTFDNAGTLVGWGRNGWGEEPYGDSFNSLVQPVGVSATSSLGSLLAIPETFASLTGVEAETDLGALTTTQLTIASLVDLGLTATTTLNDAGIRLRYYEILTPKDSSGYTTKTPKNTTGYTTKQAL